MPKKDTTAAPPGASETHLVIAGIPALGPTFVGRLLDQVLTNIDAEFTAEQAEVAQAVCRAIGHAAAMAEQLGPRVEAETLVAFVASAVVEARRAAPPESTDQLLLDPAKGRS